MRSFLKKFAGFTWYPFLFILFVILSLWVENKNQIKLVDLLRPTLVFILLGVILLVLVKFLIRNWEKAGVIVFLILFALLTYGHFYAFLEDFTILGINFGRHRFLIALGGLFLSVLCALTVKCKSAMVQWTVVLNGITACLVIAQLVQLARADFREQRLSNQIQENTQVYSNSSSIDTNHLGIESKPDIYYILLDTYPRQDTFSQVFNYDNSEFLKELQARGFYVAPCSLSNYTGTSSSLVSSLQMSYLDQVNPPLGIGYTDFDFLDPYLQNSRVFNTLKKMEYTTVAFESGYASTGIQDVDVMLSPSSNSRTILFGGLSRFESLLMQSSFGILAYDFQQYWSPSIRYFMDTTYVRHRQRFLFQLEKTSNLQEIPSPKFIFNHILALHTPFVFTADGQPISVNSLYSFTDDPDLENPEIYRQRFTEQTTFLNGQLLEMIDGILANSKHPPVIILQGDHGIPHTNIWGSAILSALYLPRGEDTVYQTMSPVNTFGIIFNEYFNAGIPRLKDVSCKFNKADPSSCEVIEDPNPICQ